MALYLLQKGPKGQSCGGTHVFEALASIAKADRHISILDDSARAQLQSYLKKTCREIVEAQQPDGSWGKQWCSGLDNDEPGQKSSLQTRMLVTGHLVGILRETDDTQLIPTATYERAANWLQSALKSQEVGANSSWLCPVTHAAASLRDVEQVQNTPDLPAESPAAPPAARTTQSNKIE
jgi:hypothetical protein